MIHLIALYIIGGIVLFFAFIASLRAEVLIAYSDEFRLTVRVLGIPIKILPKKKKKEAAKAKKKADKAAGKVKPKKPIGDVIEMIKDLVAVFVGRKTAPSC